MALVLGDALGVGLQVLDFTMSYMPTSVPYVPFPTPSPPLHSSPMSVNPAAGGIGSPNPAILATVEMTDDPVTKAVMENVLGRLPTKKPRVTVLCDVCNLEFSSQTVLDSHTAGSKHQRKVKSADLLRTLQETEKGFERDEVSGVIRCTVCDVTVNSPQLLATHIAGNKHRQRAAKQASPDSADASPAKRFCNAAGVTGGSVSNSNGESAFDSEKGGTTTNSGLEIPECVTKLEDTKGGGKYLCTKCEAHCNSEQQLAQHLQSKKHLEKLSGRKPRGSGFRGRGGGRFRGRWRPNYRRGRGGPGHMQGGGGGPVESGSFSSDSAPYPPDSNPFSAPSSTFTPPLSSNFVAGGSIE